MFVKFLEILISMLIIKTSEGISLNVIGSSFTKNIYSNSHVILANEKVGPLMCIGDCMLYKGCNAVNFNRSNFECELLNVFPGDIIIDMDNSIYTDIGGWMRDKDGCTINPCEVGQKCISAMYNQTICLTFDTPCDSNPCQNKRVCRNKVNGYRCICPEGYDGVNCEWNFEYLTDSSAIISSPGYPNYYTNNLRYKYSIRVQPGHNITLTVSVSRFHTEACCDHVRVYNGSTMSSSLLPHLSGSISSSITVKSTSNNMLVVFTSDKDITRKGFNATYFS